MAENNMMKRFPKRGFFNWDPSGQNRMFESGSIIGLIIPLYFL